MSLDEIRTYCLSLPGATEDTPWEEHFAYKVGGKAFLFTGSSNIPSLSLKVTPDAFDELIELEGIKQAPYLAKRMWVHLDAATRLSSKELKRRIRDSYDLVVAGLPKKLQRSLS